MSGYASTFALVKLKPPLEKPAIVFAGILTDPRSNMKREPETFNLTDLPNRKLGEASAQEIQLELIRRRKFNAFDGEQVAEALVKHRDLWESAFMDRLGVHREDRELPAMSMIKLRDLEYDWNVDTLYILTHDVASAKRLMEVFAMDEFCGETHLIENPDEVGSAIGSGPTEQAIVAVWWD